MCFTHIDFCGNAIMVDVGGKPDTHRNAVAAGSIRMSERCFRAVLAGRARKGDVLGVAQVAGIMAAKETGRLIPLCHSVSLSAVSLSFEPAEAEHTFTATCATQCTGPTGVEMEALTGVSVALLTLYDMCKAMDREMEIFSIHLVEKQGGQNGHSVNREDTP